MALLTLLVPAGILLSTVLLVVAAVGSSRDTHVGRAQREAARARRRGRAG